jgi:hypothetical protein
MRLFIQNDVSNGAHVKAVVCYPDSHYDVDTSRSMMLHSVGGHRIVVRPVGQSEIPVLESGQPSVTAEDSLLDIVQNAISLDVIHVTSPDGVLRFVFLDSEKPVTTKCATVHLDCNERVASTLWVVAQNAQQLESFERRLRTESIVVDEGDDERIEESLFSTELKIGAAELSISKCRLFPAVVRSAKDFGCVVEIEGEVTNGELEARIYWCEEDGNLPELFFLDGMQCKQFHSESFGSAAI